MGIGRMVIDRMGREAIVALLWLGYGVLLLVVHLLVAVPVLLVVVRLVAVAVPLVLAFPRSKLRVP